jgi:hypothetical protein
MSNTTTTQAAVTITGSGKVCAVINGQSYTIANDHPKYKQVIESIKQKNWDLFVDLVNITKQVQNYASGGVSIQDGAVIYNGEVIHNTLTNRIVKFMGEGLPFEPLVKFMENLMRNPSKRAVDELFDFMDAGEMPITEDGQLLAYKNVRSTYMDIHSGTFRNQVGDICEMPRNRVCDNKDQTCSAGLHFCSINYLPNFADSNGGKTMIVKINPKDCISFPVDYANTKGRCCRYEVVAEYKEDWRSKIQKGESGWDSFLYTSDGDEYDSDEEDYDDEENNYGSCCGNGCQYGVKPSGQKFHNVRDNTGKFSKKM